MNKPKINLIKVNKIIVLQVQIQVIITRPLIRINILLTNSSNRIHLVYRSRRILLHPHNLTMGNNSNSSQCSNLNHRRLENLINSIIINRWAKGFLCHKVNNKMFLAIFKLLFLNRISRIYKGKWIFLSINNKSKTQISTPSQPNLCRTWTNSTKTSNSLHSKCIKIKCYPLTSNFLSASSNQWRGWVDNCHRIWLISRLRWIFNYRTCRLVISNSRLLILLIVEILSIITSNEINDWWY